MRVLTEDAENDRIDFESLDTCCSCHINPPCGWCTHAGNPLNQEEDDSCWIEVDDYNKLEDNNIPFGLLRLFDLYKQAENDGYKFERFSHMGILMNPVWEEVSISVDEFKFTDTYRLKKNNENIS